MDVKNYLKTRRRKVAFMLFRLCCLAAFFAFFWQTGMNAQAAETEKKPPLENLAEGKKGSDLTTGDGMTISNPEKMIDGDKYNLKEKGKKRSDGSWEAYVESNAVTTVTGQSGQPVWVQLDLGAVYPIEVINLKRQVYQGTPGVTGNRDNWRLTGTKYTYQNTAIVIGTKEDLSDGQVIYYAGNVDLPKGVEKPSESSSVYQEAMGGKWFYMDYTADKGLGYTPLGTVKNARYVRVYSQTPDSDSVNFMELAVYGYKNRQSVQKPTGLRKQIDNEHPLMIAAAYSSDTFEIGQEENVGLQGWNTIAGRWNAIPDDLKDNNVLMMHSNNLNSFSPDHVGQATVQAYYEACLKEGYEAGASVMLMLMNASAVPNGAHWCITRDVDENWVDLMFRMYPNMEGVFNTENFWSGHLDKVAATMSHMLEIAHRHGGYVVYSEGDHGNSYSQLTSQNVLREAAELYGDRLFLTYKNTNGSNDGLNAQSSLLGSWLSGYIGGWGMLSDTWAWANNGNGHAFEGLNGAQGWQGLCAEPEAIFGMQMLTTYLSGGVVYTFEFPEVVYGAIDEKSPAYAHVVERVFRYVCENPAPDRKQILNETKVMLYGNAPSSLYAKTVGADNAMVLLGNGRYGAIPTLPNWGTQAEVTQKLRETAKKEGASAPIMLSNGDGLLGYGAEEYFKMLYPIDYLGDAFAEKYKNAWYIYNSSYKQDIEQDATFALEAEETARFTAQLQPHTFAVMEESGDKSLQISLNNYRINHKRLIFDNPHGWSWSGSSATGQGVSPAKVSVYRYMAYYNVYNAKKGVDNKETPGTTIDQISPNDNSSEFRTSTFKISKLASKPTVQVTAGQEPDTDGEAQYRDPVVSYDANTKIATITIESNGWVDLKVTDLNYEVDPDAVKIEDPSDEGGDGDGDENDGYGNRTNMALNKTVTASHDPSGGGSGMARPLTYIVDGNKDANSYSDPGGDDGGPVWVQIDLGNLQRVDEVKLYRYYADSRRYHNTVIMLSPDANFDADKTLILWNANGTNGGKNGQAITQWTDKSGQSHQLPEGDEPTYQETSQGKSFKVWDETVEWMDQDANRQKPAENEYFEARYVRVYENGGVHSSDFTSNHYVEVEVYGRPKNGAAESVNLAPKASISASANPSGDRSLQIAIDGQKASLDGDNAYTDPGGDAGGAHWIQLDMGLLNDVEAINLYRYWADGRKYYDTVVMLSPKKDFPADSTLVLWNSNRDADSDWPGNGNGTTGTHKLPQGAQSEYNETNQGKTFQVGDSTASWLDAGKTDALPADSFGARYVRVYMNGNDKGNPCNHVVEIEVIGKEGEFVLEDTEAPEQVTGLEVKKNYPGHTIIAFLPAMDNMGVREYVLTIKDEHDTEQTVTLNQTQYELDRKLLKDGETYEITVKAIDYYDNESESSEPVSFKVLVESDFLVAANPKGGMYKEAQQVELSVSCGEGEIYYTLDGSKVFDEKGNPSNGAKEYTGPISIATSHVLHAALKIGEDVFPGRAYAYLINPSDDEFDAPVTMIPDELQITDVSSTTARIGWGCPNQDASPAVEYRIYVNGEVKQTRGKDRATGGIDMYADLEGLTPGKAYRIYITAVNQAGNESLRSETIEFVTKKQ